MNNYGLTDEQASLVREAIKAFKEKDLNNYILKANAIAGSGKTHTLVTLTNELKKLKPEGFKFKYITYLKKLADEAEDKFPRNQNKRKKNCSTIHSLAYQYTVQPFKLKVTQYDLKPRHITLNVKDRRKELMLRLMEDFFISEYLSFEIFMANNKAELTDEEYIYIENKINRMKTGEDFCTHNFYLKFFHVGLEKGFIKHEELDLLMLDEAGDLNPVTLQIFLLIDAKIKALVGDSKQNIYSFNGTINGFKVLEKHGKQFDITHSFRVSDRIANYIEPFCQTYLDPDMTFVGKKYPAGQEIKTKAYISRTNATLVDKMIELDRIHKPYNLTRSPGELFALPLTLLMMKKETYDWENSQHKYLKDDLDTYNGSILLQRQYKTLMAYIMYVHNSDIAIKSACMLILKHGPKAIFDTWKNAKNHEVNSKEHEITLTTAHSSKGLEWHHVHVLEDLNIKLDDLLDEANDKIKGGLGKNVYDVLLDNQLEEFRLYYIVVSRAMHKITNAKHLMQSNIE